jgi:aminoglycoside phosphotransferase (APT) family kinase protein
MNRPQARPRVARLRNEMTYYRIVRRMRKWRDMANARRRIAGILSELPAAVRDDGGARWKLHWITWTGSSALDTNYPPMGTRVAAAVGPEERPAFVLKFPSTDAEARGLRRQQRAMALIRESPSIGAWRELIPSVAEEESSAGRTFFIETALPGRNADELIQTVPRVELLCQAARIIRGLHEGTGVAVLVDEDAFRRWVSDPLGRLRRVGQDVRPGRDWRGELVVVQEELREALLGRVVWSSWIHGDFWLGNVLMQHESEVVTGVIDWDRAGPAELAVQDIVHLLLVARMYARPTQCFFGDVVRAFLDGAVWTADERQVLSEADLPFSIADPRGHRTLVLLCWIRRVLSDLDGTDSPPNELWVMRNIESVLAHARQSSPVVPEVHAVVDGTRNS